jgi:hypothetical protein
VDFLRRVAAAFRAAVERFADFLLRVAAAFFAAVDRLRAVDFRPPVAFLRRVAAAFRPAAARFGDFRLRAVLFLAVDRLAVLLLRAVDLFRVAAMVHLLSNVRTPYASGVAALVR